MKAVYAWNVNHHHPPSLRKESVTMKPTQVETDLYQRTPITESPYAQEIRVRAYQLFEQRGREPGHDLEDWLQAEAEIVRPARSQIRGVAA
jgi:hypothetical protein